MWAEHCLFDNIIKCNTIQCDTWQVIIFWRFTYIHTLTILILYIYINTVRLRKTICVVWLNTRKRCKKLQHSIGYENLIQTVCKSQIDLREHQLFLFLLIHKHSCKNQNITLWHSTINLSDALLRNENVTHKCQNDLSSAVILSFTQYVCTVHIFSCFRCQ